MVSSRYGIFCAVVDQGSFTKAAQGLGYTQSAVSQAVRALEGELGCTLLDRRGRTPVLTRDGELLMPSIRAVAQAEEALDHRRREVAGLEGATIRVGTFTSVSRNLLPSLIARFKQDWPSVRFVLRQGEYVSIAEWLREGSVDLGFVNADSAQGLVMHPLVQDDMMAVLPQGHPLAAQDTVTLGDLAAQPLILLDEGTDKSVALQAFRTADVEPQVEYTVTDDYSILAMVREGLGVAILYGMMLEGFADGLEVRPIDRAPHRNIALAWENDDTLPLAARRFADLVLAGIQG